MHKNTSFIIPSNNKNKNHYNDFSTKKTIVMGILKWLRLYREESFYLSCFLYNDLYSSQLSISSL